MNAQIAVLLGDFVTDRIVLVAVVPVEAPTAEQVKALHFLAGEAHSPDRNNYWNLQAGVLVAGAFQVLGREVAFTDGFTVGRLKTVTYEPPLPLSRGDKLAVRLSPRGAPPPLIGLSVAPEWGVLSTRRP